ncbi:hypothetical protein BDF22DRAFT_658377 [Syncephalis plumigaleata]|nr:hypothetical protein BDF22DRAFT_750664 [Syncephalis plumigaleata]KAI8048414.1 hypothetical protein BDF22DRAFT_658377 [Syncephalis plumigaleata]
MTGFTYVVAITMIIIGATTTSAAPEFPRGTVAQLPNRGSMAQLPNIVIPQQPNTIIPPSIVSPLQQQTGLQDVQTGRIMANQEVRQLQELQTQQDMTRRVMSHRQDSGSIDERFIRR